MSNEKRLSDITREKSANRVNKFADSLMPSLPTIPAEPPAAAHQPVDQTDVAITMTPTPTQPTEPVAPVPTLRPERARKNGGFTIDDIVNGSATDGDVFNKMVRVTDEHHELLRLMAFKYRKPMNVLVHNLMVLLNQAYQKELKGESTNV